jgi:hypothetical protein
MVIPGREPHDDEQAEDDSKVTVREDHRAAEKGASAGV